MWVVYIIKCNNREWYYIGSTNDIERRLYEHNAGCVRSTKAYRPLRIVYTKEFDSEASARQYEHMLKHKRIEKEKIIRSLVYCPVV